MVQRMLKAILRNITMKVNNVEIAYLCRNNSSRKPDVALGIQIQSVSLLSTDQQGEVFGDC